MPINDLISFLSRTFSWYHFPIHDWNSSFVGLAGDYAPTPRGRGIVSGNVPNSSRGMASIIGGGDSARTDIHVMPPAPRPTSAHAAKHTHSNGVKSSLDSTFAPSSTGASNYNTPTPSGIRTYNAIRQTSAQSPFFDQTIASRTMTLSPVGRRTVSRARKSIGGSYDDSSVGSSSSSYSDLPPTSASAAPVMRYKKNHALNSSQMFTAIAPSYDPSTSAMTSSTPVTARLTAHLDQEVGAAEAQVGDRDVRPSQHLSSNSLGGNLRRSKEEAMRIFNQMEEAPFAGGTRPDKLGHGKGKKHIHANGPAQNSVNYDILAPPSAGPATPVDPSVTRAGTAKASVANIAGVTTALEQVSLPTALECEFRSKPVAVQGVTGSIAVSNFAKLCMGSESEEGLPKTIATIRQPPGYRDAQTFSSNFMALVPLENAPRPASTVAGGSGDSASSSAAPMVSRAPFGNDFNDSIVTKPHKVIGPRDVRNPITGALNTTHVNALKSDSHFNSMKNTSAGATQAAGISTNNNNNIASPQKTTNPNAKLVNKIWGFDDSSSTTTSSSASAAAAKPVVAPYATVNVIGGEGYVTSTLHGRIATPATATATAASSSSASAPAVPASASVSAAPSAAATPRVSATLSTTYVPPSASSSSSSSSSANSFASAFAAAAVGDSSTGASKTSGGYKPLYTPVNQWKVDV